MTRDPSYFSILISDALQKLRHEIRPAHMTGENRRYAILALQEIRNAADEGIDALLSEAKRK